MTTGLPPDQEPVIQDVRCLCRRLYRVFTGEDYQLRLAKKEALEAGAIFIDTRVTPFFECRCGEQLDFAPVASSMIQ
jgi:hypothetical protein